MIPVSNGIRVGGGGGSIYYYGGSSWSTGSDVRLKEDIRDAEPMMDRLMQLPVGRFKWKTRRMIRLMTWAWSPGKWSLFSPI